MAAIEMTKEREGSRLGKTNEKKVILCIVEGPSDETALALIFERIFIENNRVFFDVLHTDITTAHLFDALPGSIRSLDNIKDAVRQEVVGYIQNKPYKWSDLSGVIHLMDTDGAFVSDDYVRQGTEDELEYFEDCIVAGNPDFIMRRNCEKSKRMKALSHMRHLTYNNKTIDYRAYFLSRNLDHALYGFCRELTREEKESQAKEFRAKYKNDIPGFLSFINGDSVAIEGDYLQTWDYISQDLHSLGRGSNMHLIFVG